MMNKLEKLFICLIFSSCAMQIGEQYRFQKVLEERAEKMKKGGFVVGVFRNGKSLFKKAYGFDSDGKALISDKVFRLASVSKQFTAFSIAILTNQRKLSLRASIRKYLPELPVTYQTVKIEYLVYHTGGVKEYLDLCQFKGKNLESILGFLSKQSKLESPPGTTFQYSNTGYVLLASILERVVKKSFSQFLKEYIFGPLKMNQSKVVEVADLKKNASWCDSLYGDGGIISTVDDLGKWVQALKGPIILNSTSLAKVLSSGKVGHKETGYAFGLGIGQNENFQTVYSHEGEWKESFASFNYYKESDLLIVHLGTSEKIPIGKIVQAIESEILERF